MEKLAIQLSCYNGARYLPHLFASLMVQTFTDWKFYVFDNASDVENAKLIREAVAVLGEKFVCSRVEQNIDFVGAHNLLWRFHSAPLVQLLNDDAILEPEYLERLVSVMDQNPKCASASGLIYRWDFDRVNEAWGGKTDIVDSAGLERHRTWKVSDRFAGNPLQATSYKLPATESVFGVSGCLPMYRRDAIEKTSPDHLLFDPIFQSYKEDVEVACRLQRFGYVSLVDDGAVAYHRRSFAPGTRVMQNWRPAFHSYRNHLWTLCYHLTWKDFKKNGFWILTFEFAKKIYWLLKRPAVVVETWKETWRRRKELLARRKFYQNYSL